MARVRLVVLLLASAAATIATFLPVWSSNPGHGRRCACGADFVLGNLGFFVPAVLVGAIATARVILARAAAPSPLPRAAVARRSAYHRLVSRWNETWSAAASSSSFRNALEGVHMLAAGLVVAIAVYAFTLEGTGWLPILLSHLAVFALRSRRRATAT